MVGQMELLSSLEHASLRMHAHAIEPAPFVITTLNEFPAAAAVAPIFFAKDSETGEFYAGTIFGFRPGENLIEGADRGKPLFRPLELQRQGFFISDENIAIDVGHPRFAAGGSVALFEADGQPSAAMRSIQQTLGQLKAGIEATRDFIRLLLELKLIEPVDMGLRFDDGETLQLEGLYTVSRDGLMELPDARVIELFRNGYLQAAHCMTFSLNQVAVLAQRRNSRPLIVEAPPRTLREAHPDEFCDAAAFRRDIVAAGLPVAIRGLYRDWPMVRAASEGSTALARYLARFATPAPAELFVGAPDIAGRYFYGDRLEGFNFERQTMDLPAALKRILANAATPGTETAYLGSLPSQTYLPGLGDENPSAVLDPPLPPRIWIGNSSRISCHFDTYDNLAAVVAGHRRFTLYPPEAIADLYVGPLDHTMAGQPVGLADDSARGDPRYPRFEAWRDRAFEVELAPGDALYLPKLWWHRVEATAPLNVLINYWWDGASAGPDAPYTAMLLAMIAIAERPPRERLAWRAFFDHYVFRPNGHPLAHLPDEHHGILGPLADGRYGRLRSLIMRLMRGD